MITQVISKEVSENTSIICWDDRACSVDELSRDLRRMLAVQFKEFIHTIEDLEQAGQRKYRMCLDMR